MQKWKFIIAGITGDLARRKILPALGEFSNIFSQKLDIEVIGYSRSQPDHEAIYNSLNSKRPSKIKNVKFYTGQYDDPSFFINLMQDVSAEKKIIFYFAVPPQVFLLLLENLCPYHTKNIDIVIEKPFGNNMNEAKKIIDKVHECKLTEKTRYCDHYMFKSGLQLDDKTLEIIKNLPMRIESISIKALETIDVQGRSSYYEGVGAIKDMIPAHFYTLIKSLQKVLQREIDINDDGKIFIRNVKLGQYQGYLEQIQRQTSSTETYFLIDMYINQIAFVLESGKKLDRKETSITILYENNTTLYWRIDPDPILLLDSEEIHIQNREAVSDHTRLFMDILFGNYDRFLNESDVINGWRIYENIKNFIVAHKIYPEIY
jgi:glucose-6-phosphate 1-dehydrogenase